MVWFRTESERRPPPPQVKDVMALGRVKERKTLMRRGTPLMFQAALTEGGTAKDARGVGHVGAQQPQAAHEEVDRLAHLVQGLLHLQPQPCEAEPRPAVHGLVPAGGGGGKMEEVGKRPTAPVLAA